MEEKDKLRSLVHMAVFLLAIILLGAVSAVKLVRFYVWDTVDYNEWSADLGSRLETDIATCFFQKTWFVDLNGAVRTCLGQQEMNGIVKLDNGWLTTVRPGPVPEEVLRASADAVIGFARYLEDEGIAFLYCITPYTVSPYDPQLPAGIEDHGNEDLDKLREMLEDGGVELIDFREEMYEDGIDQYDMLYRTDHHWDTRAGFYAYQKMDAWLKRTLDCEVDPAVEDPSNYRTETYEAWHLGSRGQRTGAYFSGIDDFELVLPEFGTSLERVDDAEGTFEELVIDRSALQERDRASRYTYDTVLGNANANYVNHAAWNDERILALTDSFGKAVDQFLLLAYREFRYAYKGVSAEEIETYRPDAVVMFYYVDNALDPGFYKNLPLER